jgi:hypothetical protein
MNEHSESTERTSVELGLFAATFFSLVVGATGIVLLVPVLAILGLAGSGAALGGLLLRQFLAG